MFCVPVSSAPVERFFCRLIIRAHRAKMSHLVLDMWFFKCDKDLWKVRNTQHSLETIEIKFNLCIIKFFLICDLYFLIKCTK